MSSLEKEKTNWKIIITAGIGFFTDAYDLFVIGVVTALLAPIWHLSTDQLALLNGASLAAAAFGAIFFGILSDKLGRKKMYGVEIIILFIGALLSAFAPSFGFLLFARILVGFGIGGDYPSSAVVASEHSSKNKRGYTVLLVFAMQALGLIVGPALASIFLVSHIPDHIVWRLLLGLGAIPAACVFFMRRKIQETPHFLKHQEAPVEVSRVVSELTGYQEPEQDLPKYPKSLFSKKWLTYLLGTAGAWFALDVVFYGNGVSSVLIIKSLDPDAHILMHTIISACIFLVFAVPGYFLAARFIDRIGRLKLQIFGFIMIALAYAAIAFIPSVTALLPLFIIIFGISFFFVNFGPNTTTFLIPAEIFPTRMRAKAHGISAAVAKVGAFIGAFFLPLMLHAEGLRFTLGVLTFVAIAGALVSLVLPEMKQQELD